MRTVPTGGRGRPRPQETINRDRRILEILRQDGPLSRNEIWDRVSEEDIVSPMQIWLSLNRLRKDQLVTVYGSAQGARWEVLP